MSTRFVVYSNGENSYSVSRLILQHFLVRLVNKLLNLACPSEGKQGFQYHCISLITQVKPF